MKQIFRIFFCAICLLIVSFSAIGEKGTENALIQWSEKDSVLELSWLPEVHVPYSQERLSMLTDLMKHLSLRWKNRSNESTLSILLDQEPFFVSTEIHQNGKRSLLLSSEPLQCYESEENGRSMLADALGIDTPETSLAGIHVDEPIILYGIKDILNQLPDIFQDRLKEEKVRSSLGKYGTTVKKETLILNGDEDAVRLVTFDTNCITSQWFDQLRFNGKQTVVWFYDETGQCIKTTYSGKCGIGEDLRNVYLNWRSLNSESGSKEELLFKSPGVKTGNRNNLTFSQETVIHNDETLSSISFSMDKVHNNQRNLVVGELSWNENRNELGILLSGNANLTQTDPNGVKTYLKLEPIYTLSDANIKGTLGYSFSHVKNSIAEKGTICFEIYEADDEPVSLKHDNCIKVNLEEKTKNAILSSFTNVFLRKIMELPEEDLTYISKDLSKQQWESIKKLYRETSTDR